MNLHTILWALQIILGIKMLNVSYSHGLRHSQPEMQEAIQKMGGFSRPVLYAVSACTLIGTVGLILPGIVESIDWITPFTAVLLSAMLLVSIFLHVRAPSKPRIFVSAILLAFAVFIAYGRWILVPS